GMATDEGAELELLEPLASILKAFARNNVEAFEQRLGLFAPMRFDNAGGDIIAVLLARAGLLQHFVRFADAGRGADENLEPAGLALFPPGRLEQGLRRGSLVRVAALLHHQD